MWSEPSYIVMHAPEPLWRIKNHKGQDVYTFYRAWLYWSRSVMSEAGYVLAEHGLFGPAFTVFSDRDPTFHPSGTMENAIPRDAVLVVLCADPTLEFPPPDEEVVRDFRARLENYLLALGDDEDRQDAPD